MTLINLVLSLKSKQHVSWRCLYISDCTVSQRKRLQTSNLTRTHHRRIYIWV